MKKVFGEAIPLAIGAYVWMLILVGWVTYHHLYVHQDYPKPQLSIIDRLDALEAEMKTATEILAIMSGYESLGPDEDTTGYGQSKTRMSVGVIGDSISPDPDTLPAVERISDNHFKIRLPDYVEPYGTSIKDSAAIKWEATLENVLTDEWLIDHGFEYDSITESWSPFHDNGGR